MRAREEHISINRSARLFLLGEPNDAREVWVVCHGYAQLARRFIRDFESIAAPQRLIVAPEAQHRFYLDQPPIPASDRRVGATWMTREDREYDISDYVSYLDQVVDYVAARAAAPFRLVVLGFSQGSATVFRWAAQGRAKIDELILWAGEVPHDADLAAAGRKLAATRVIITRGSKDRMIARDRAERDHSALEAAGMSCEIRDFDGGHEIEPALLATLAGEL